MKNPENSDELLSPARAAAVAGMRRTAFLRHVEAGRVMPDAVSGSHKFFKLSTIQRWLTEREQNGIRKRGPKPQQQAA